MNFDKQPRNSSQAALNYLQKDFYFARQRFVNKLNKYSIKKYRCFFSAPYVMYKKLNRILCIKFRLLDIPVRILAILV